MVTFKEKPEEKLRHLRNFDKYILNESWCMVREASTVVTAIRVPRPPHSGWHARPLTSKLPLHQ